MALVSVPLWPPSLFAHHFRRLPASVPLCCRLPDSSGSNSTIGVGDHNLPLGAVLMLVVLAFLDWKSKHLRLDLDGAVEGFRVPEDSIVQWLRRLVQLGALKEPALADDFFVAIHCDISNFMKDDVLCPFLSHSSNSMWDISPVGAEASQFNAKNIDQHEIIISVPDSAENSKNNHPDKNTGTATVRRKVTNSRTPHPDPSDDGNGSDENEKKKKGRWGFVNAIAALLPSWFPFLVAYWHFFCPDTLNISKNWMDVLLLGTLILFIISCILYALASYFKDRESPDNLGFNIFKIVQHIVFQCLGLASLASVCVFRGISNGVVWSVVAMLFCIIVLTWVVVLQQPQIVIKSAKAMFGKVRGGLRNLSLPECIKAKLKKMTGKLRNPSLPECIKAKFKKMTGQLRYPSLTVELV